MIDKRWNVASDTNLPAPMLLVIVSVTIKNDSVFAGATAYSSRQARLNNQNRWLDEEGVFIVGEVTHWQPFPEPVRVGE